MFGTWKQEIESLKEKINTLQKQIQESEYNFHQRKDKASRQISGYQQRVKRFFSTQLEKDREATQKYLSKMAPYLSADWQSPHWDVWAPQGVDLQSLLYSGKFVDTSTNGTSTQYEIPAFLPFIGENKTVIIQGGESNTPAIYALMHALAMRINLMIPHQCQFTFLDPSGFGKAFPIATQLQTRDSQSDPYRVLEEVMNDMRRIIGNYGLSDNKPFDSIADNVMINERMEFIFAANFPKNYDRRTIERLQNIGNNGPIAGKYLFIHHNKSLPFPRDISLGSFENKFQCDLTSNSFSYQDLSLTYVPDEATPEVLQTTLLKRLKDSKPPERKIDFDTEVAVPESKLWKDSAVEYIETSIGRSGRSDPLNVWFGAKKSEGNRPCSHGMLAAMTGSGKSNLYHVMIMGLALRYSPKEIALYLIDGKDGVEFQPYKYLPHAEFVSLKSQPQLSRSILAELLEEKERRNELFASEGVSDYEGYRNKLGERSELPRILLLVDEYQELFEGDRGRNRLQQPIGPGSARS